MSRPYVSIVAPKLTDPRSKLLKLSVFWWIVAMFFIDESFTKTSIPVSSRLFSVEREIR